MRSFVVIRFVVILTACFVESAECEVLTQSFVIRLNEMAQVIEDQKQVIEDQKQIIEHFNNTQNEMRQDIEDQKQMIQDQKQTTENLTLAVEEHKQAMDAIRDMNSTLTSLGQTIDTRKYNSAKCVLSHCSKTYQMRLSTQGQGI